LEISRKRDAEQIAQAAVGQPVAVEPPFAARIEQAIGGEDLEERIPVSALAADGQAGRPEDIQIKLLPQLARHPARAPLARAVQRELAQADLDGVAHVGGNRVGGGEKRQLSGGLAIGVKDGDGPGPGGLLAVADLTQVKELALDPGAAGGADLLGDGPVAVILAVLAAAVAVQKGFTHIWAGSLPQTQPVGRGWVCTKRIGAQPVLENIELFGALARKNSSKPSPVAKVRLKFG
jgi:hypothetical protein